MSQAELEAAEAARKETERKEGEAVKAQIEELARQKAEAEARGRCHKRVLVSKLPRRLCWGQGSVSWVHQGKPTPE